MTEHIHWLDFSDQHGKDLLKALHDLNDQETVDELGLGRIRDYYGDIFFPGLTSIMTKARYFIFIPAMYSYFENKKRRISRGDVINKQKQLRDILKRNVEDKKGIIGIRKEDIMRWPDDIYWGGLVTLKIYAQNKPRHYYINSIGMEEKPLHDNDQNIRTEYKYKLAWDFPFENFEKVFFKDTGNWRDDLSFELTKKEALFLKEKVEKVDNLEKRPESIFSYLIKRNKKCEEDVFWAIPSISKRKDVDEARRFSVLSKGLWLNYYFLLQRAKENKGKADSLLDKFENWRDNNINELRHWDFKVFLRVLLNEQYFNRHVIDQGDAEFLMNTYKNITRKKSDSAVLTDNRHLIVDREKKKKDIRAKLSNESALKDWDGDTDKILKSDYQYDYLWHNPARGIINDILIGLNRHV